jgi:hypothetical protein
MSINVRAPPCYEYNVGPRLLAFLHFIYVALLRKSRVLSARSLPHKPLSLYAQSGGIQGADREAPNPRIHSNHT